jgi:cytochrome c553
MTKNIACKILTSMSAMGCIIITHPAAASAETTSDLAQVCAGCHGENGVPIDKTTPIIWGQNRAYLLNQLYDFKVGHRKNETMSAVASSLSKTDIESLATHFSNLKWPNLRQPQPPADSQDTAHKVLNSINCRACHHEYYQGDTTRPRLAGQQEEYLVKTMTDFRNGERTNYAGMTALMRAVHETALKPLAAYLASLQTASPPN